MPDHERPPSLAPAGAPDSAPEGSDPTTAFAEPTTAAGGQAPEADAGRYRIGDEIARGGVGIVYRAHDPAINRDVAVKVLQERFRNQPVATRRFVEEGRITGQLQHPGIPAVHEIGTLPDGSPFLAMKLVKGVTLAKQIAGPSPDRGRLVAVYLQVAQAVGYAHSKGVIHRDLKPANIMVGQFGEVQVMDWGLAKVLAARVSPPDHSEIEPLPQLSLIESDRPSDPSSETQAGSVMGTPAYMSPEQAGGEVDLVDERADVFGLGAVLCTILTGEPPFRDKTAEAIRLRAVRGQVEDAYARLDGCGADPEVIALCKRCLAPGREGRPRNGAAVAEAVAAHLAAVEERLRRAERDRAAAQARAAEQRTRRRWQAAVAAAGVLLLALLGAGAWWADRQAAERAKDRAVAAERDRQEAAALLAHAEAVLAAGDLAAAEVALAQAAGRVGADGPEDLRDRLAVTRRDLDLVRGLREIDDLSWSPGPSSAKRTRADMAARYQAVFARYGLDVGGADPTAAADAVRASRVSAALHAGLGEWFATDPGRPHLRQLLDRLDPDPGRVAVRAAVHAGDADRVRALVAGLDGSRAPAWFAASVGYLEVVPAADGVRLMAAAWRTHPADYPLAYRMARRLFFGSEAQRAEAFAWARVAVALRPDSPFAHNLLGFAWQGMGKLDAAEASFRRAVELAQHYPGYAAAHFNLGSLLRIKGDLDGAEGCYRTALAIDPNSPGGHFNMGLLCATRNDLTGAEQWYRKAIALDPTWAYAREVLDALLRRRALLTRLDEVVAGRADPATAAEAIELADLVSGSPRGRHALAVSFYRRAFASDPGLADKYPHRYAAACCATLAAAGQDVDRSVFGVEEWGYFTGLALQWLRAELTRLSFQTQDPKRRQEVREQLTHWRKDADLTSVRDPAWLAAMPPADRPAWERLWADVDALLAALDR